MKFFAGFTIFALAVSAFATPTKRDATTVENDINAINTEVLKLNTDIAAFVAAPTTGGVTVSISYFSLIACIQVELHHYEDHHRRSHGADSPCYRCDHCFDRQYGF